MKSKATTFKNPFDILDEDEDQIIQMKPEQKYQPPNTGKVHVPLPFDPYNNENDKNLTFQNTSKENSSSQQSTNYSTILKAKKNAQKNKAGFSNPFGTEFEPEDQMENASLMSGPVGFNPEQTPQAINQRRQQNQKQFQGQLNEDGDPPLLEDIGIDLDLIKQRILMTVKLQKPQYEQLENTDLSGPICIAMLFGCLLLLSGKIHFGDIYAMVLFGNTIMYFLLNFMSQNDIIPLYNVMSVLGYSLLPMLLLGFFGIFLSLRGTIGILISLSIAGWASYSAGNFLQVHLRQPHSDRKVLLVYPLFLFYLCFAMIVIF